MAAIGIENYGWDMEIYASLSFLPKCGRYGDIAARLKTDCVFCADRAADTAAVASFGVYYDLFICGTVSYGAELADAHALPAAVALVRIDYGDIFRPVHNWDSLRHRAAHGKAIRAVAVANSSNKGCMKSPDTVTKTFLLMAAQSGNSLVFAERLESGRIRALKKAVVEAAEDLAESSAVRCDTDAVAVTFLAAECDVPADGGDTNNRVHETEDLLDILNRNDLSVMDLLHFSADEPSEDGLDEPRSLWEFV